METCKFGADDQKLQGAARDTFMKKCMANKDDPRGPAVGAPPRCAARRRHSIDSRQNEFAAKCCNIAKLRSACRPSGTRC